MKRWFQISWCDLGQKNYMHLGLYAQKIRVGYFLYIDFYIYTFFPSLIFFYLKSIWTLKQNLANLQYTEAIK